MQVLLPFWNLSMICLIFFCEDNEKRATIAEYVKKRNITKEKIAEYVSFFPDNVSKAIEIIIKDNK